MEISWNSISAGAMTAGVSVSSALQSFGSQAATALHTAGAAANAAAAPLAPLAPQAVQLGAAGSNQLAQNLALVEKPTRAVAAGVRSQGALMRFANFLGKALPVVTITASAFAGAQIVQNEGKEALLRTKNGRGSVLGAAGGALMLMPFPPAQLAAAGVLGLVAVNQFGGLDRLNRAPTDPAPST